MILGRHGEDAQTGRDREHKLVNPYSEGLDVDVTLRYMMTYLVESQRVRGAWRPEDDRSDLPKVALLVVDRHGYFCISECLLYPAGLF